MSETIEAAPVAPVADAVASTPAPSEAAPVETPAEGTETPVTEAEPEPAPVKKDWKETRIDQLTREKHEARREVDRYKALLEAKPTNGEAPGAGYVPETEVERRAAALVEQRQFADKITEWDKRGNKEFTDFGQRCATVAGLGLAPNEKPAFMACIADMPDGHKLVAYLADHPDEAMALSREPDHRMALKLSAISTTLNKPAPVSRAPAPVSAVGGSVSTTPDLNDPKMSMKEWAALFAKTTTLKGIRK
jgi:hypothetical protein